MKYVLCLLLLAACNFANNKRMVHVLCFDPNGEVNLDETFKTEALDVNALGTAKTCVFTIMTDDYYSFLSP